MSAELAGDEELALAVALACELLHGSGALLVSVALDRAEPALIECPRLRAIVVRDADCERELPHDVADSIDLPALPLMRRLPPLEADAQSGTIGSVLGGLEMLGRAVREIAGLLPGRSVVAAEYETTDPGMPLGVAGRDGEPVIVLFGEQEFELEC